MKQIILATLLAAWLPISMAVTPMPVQLPDEDKLITRIAFGSCLKPEDGTEIFTNIARQRPDLFVFLGDNVYAETEKNDPKLRSLTEAYNRLAGSAEFKSLRKQVPTMVTWDDHDYGLNDAGGDWPHKQTSQKLYADAWGFPEDAPQRQREGIYYASISGPVDQRVQVIVLDTRYFRSGLTRSKKRLPHGRYLQGTDTDQAVLGETQWQWLETQLRKPAEVRIIASSIQLIAEGHNWEAWHLFPKERERLYELLQQTGAEGVVVISGDRHSAAIYKYERDDQYPVWEVTSSSLNVPLSEMITDIKDEPGPHRVGDPYYDANYGIIDIDWQKRELFLKVVDEQDRVVRAASVKLDTLK